MPPVTDTCQADTAEERSVTGDALRKRQAIQANSHDSKISFSRNQKFLRTEFPWENYLFTEQVNKCTKGVTFGNSSHSGAMESRTPSRSSAKAWGLPKGFVLLPPWKRNFFHSCFETADCHCSWQRPRLVVWFEVLGYHL